MLLGVIPMFFFSILGIFGENRKKEENWKIWGKSGSYGRREPTLRRRLKPRRGIPSPRRG